MAATLRKSSVIATGHWKTAKAPLISRTSSSVTGYPRASCSFIGSIHDARRATGLLENKHNFADATNVQVYESTLTQGLSQVTLNETSSFEWLENIRQGGDPKDSTVHIMFMHLEPEQKANFKHRVSLSAPFAQKLLSTLDVTPQFTGLLLGEPDYGAPGDFANHDQSGTVQRVEFCCQQPRWAIHQKVYILVCDLKQNRLDVVKERLCDILNANRKAWNSINDSINPFFLQLLITHEVFLDAAPHVTGLRYQLYDALDRVDRYAETEANGRMRSELEDLTIQLHIVSQETDRMSANVDMSSMIVQRLIGAHERYRKYTKDPGKEDAVTKLDNALHYLLYSIESQQRWLGSYKSRKDIAMNLVFNLVTQQDSATGTTIAREAKADGSSMRVIATLTMVFLPGTFMSSVFGMAMLDNARWWLFVALTVPLTLLVIAIWSIWQSYDSIIKLLRKFRRGTNGQAKEHVV
ncbi:hypothetical protein Ptr902_00303 [Pyrenophora tritici-repentis]|nr:hypothetical protein L13192_00297 [Pyrenophora tritici-repentis]KAI2486170.1 hypothetical protein Ptr902_00303 [Pyrenophora tritici-repentis]